MSKPRIHRLSNEGMRMASDPPECGHVAYCRQMAITEHLCPDQTTWDWEAVTCRRCLTKRAARYSVGPREASA